MLRFQLLFWISGSVGIFMPEHDLKQSDQGLYCLPLELNAPDCDKVGWLVHDVLPFYTSATGDWGMGDSC